MCREVLVLKSYPLATCILYVKQDSTPNSAPDSSTPSHLNFPLPIFDGAVGASTGGAVDVAAFVVVLIELSVHRSQQ